MKRTTIFLDEKLRKDLHRIADRQGTSMAMVVREALAAYVAQPRRRAALPSVVGRFSSGTTDTSERAEELLWRDPPRIGPAAEEAFVKAIADGEFEIEDLEREDVRRASEIMHRYGDFPLGFVDAAVVAMAERLEMRDVLTTDRRHFGSIRPRHARSLSLLP